MAARATALALATALRLFTALGCGVFALSVSSSAWAQRASLTLLPVVTPESVAKPGDGAPPRTLDRHAQVLADVLADAAYDLGFELKPNADVRVSSELPDDDALLAAAQNSWVLSPRLEQSGSKLNVKLVLAKPGSTVLLSRSERLEPNLINVRAVLMLRDLIEAGRGAQPTAGTPQPTEPLPSSEPPSPRSAGRAVLALNAAVLGGYVGFSLQKASGSEDERLIYPLVAVGAGIGLGASLLVADEWDIGVGDAWYVAAGMWWPAAGGLLLARSYDVAPEDRYVYGIVGASAGIVAATAAIAAGPMSEGGATIAHSGGAFGAGLGGLTELLIRGQTERTPVRGLGYGAISGVVLGGALATQLDAPTSRVLLIDLGASLGALSGAAAASPLLLVEEETSPTRTRLWLSAVGVGTLAGGAVAWWFTSDGKKSPVADRAAFGAVPYALALPEERGGARGEFGVLGEF